jgi:putative ABC transport system permease protein
MPVLFKIALRNLREHRAKTLIIGIIIALGIAVMILGNSFTASASRGVRRSFIENYTGHIMVHAQVKGAVSLFGYQAQTGNEQIPRIPQYDRVFELVESQPEVEAVAAQVTGLAVLNFEDKGNEFTILFGVEPESYRHMFPANITIVAGRDLAPGEEGILLSENKLKDIREGTGVQVKAGDSVLLNGIGAAGFRIREVPVRGVFRFNQEVQGLNQISFVDIQTLRALLGLTVATTAQVELSEEETALLGEHDLDPEALFGGSLVSAGQAAAPAGRLDLNEEALLDILGDEGQGAYRARLDSGAWHFLLLRLKEDSQLKTVLARLNRAFADLGIAAKAVDWKTASGGFGAIADTVQVVFNVLILIVAVVAVIIIMNTLVISVIERTTEIGTMRALGAQKALVRRMFVLETMSISVVFGLIGIAAAALTIGILHLTGLRAPNSFFEVMFGGKVLHPGLPPLAVFYALLIVVGVGILASLYPVGVALKIQPVRAIQVE